MLPVVSIELPPDASKTATAMVVERCDSVLGLGRCRWTGEPPRPQEQFYARVTTAADESTSIRIELHQGGPTGTLVEVRDLVFSLDDAESSKWGAAGLVVASLVSAAEARMVRVPNNVKRPPLPALPPPVPPALHYYRYGIDLAALLGPGLDASRYRIGGAGRVFFAVPPAPHVIGCLSLRYASLATDVKPTWLTVGVGLGASLGRRESMLNAQLSWEALLERATVSAGDGGTGARDQAEQRRFGGRLQLTLALRAADWLRFVLGADASVMTPPLKIELHDQVAGRESSARFSLLGGIRLAL